MMAVITLSALYAETVVRGEGARVKILLQCTTLLSGLGGVKITRIFILWTFLLS